MIKYRKADMDDIQKLIKLRIDYLTEDRGELIESDKSAITIQLNEYFLKHIGGYFIAYLAETDFNTIAAAFLVITEKPANPTFITGKTGILLNVFTYPEYRKKGIATALLKCLIKEAKTQNLSYIELSATKSGKPLYEKFGFQIKNSRYTEMKLQFI